MTEPTDALAEQATAERTARERRTALAAAFRDAAKADRPVSPDLARLIRSRIDGTTIPTQEGTTR